MDFRMSIATEIVSALEKAFGDASLTAENIAQIMEVPPDTAMGDYAFPCFRLAKTLRKAPPMIADALKAVRDGIYQRALENRNNRTYDCLTIDEIKAVLEEKGDGFVRAMWCGEEECEDKVKEQTGVGSRCIPFEQEELSDVCVCCGKPAKHMVCWGKAY